MVPSLSSHPVPHVMTLQLYIQTVVLPFFFFASMCSPSSCFCLEKE